MVIFDVKKIMAIINIYIFYFIAYIVINSVMGMVIMAAIYITDVMASLAVIDIRV